MAPSLVHHGASMLLQQIAETLRREKLTPQRDVAGIHPAPAPTEIGRAAALHGAELLRQGFSIDQVVHDYGNVCQAVTELAVERNEPIWGLKQGSPVRKPTQPRHLAGPFAANP